MWDKFLKFLNDNKDALALLFGSGVVIAVLGGIYRFAIWLFKEYRLRKIRTNENFPFKIIPPNSNVAKEILGGADDDPLADRNIPYQQRIQGRNTRRELEELIEDNRWILITGRTGLGKTREAVQLAQSLNNEGWTILFLTHEAWLDAPAKLPTNVPERKLLFFLDDLNKKCLSSKAEIRPTANESLTLPIFESFQIRLQRTLEAFDTFCGKGEIRVIGAARNEKASEFDEPSEWDKLNWIKYSRLWEKFKLVDLPEPDKTAEQKLLEETAGKADVLIKSDELPILAKRNDGTFRNLVENLSSAKTDRVTLSSESFRDTLKGTWQKRYQKAVQKNPEAIYIYDAIELLQAVGIQVSFSTVTQVAAIIYNEKSTEQLTSERKYYSTLKKLDEIENLLHPKDGQVEAKGYRIDIYKHLPLLYRQFYFEKVNKFDRILSSSLYIIPLNSIPKSVFVPDNKLTRTEEFICSLLGLEESIHNVGMSYAYAGYYSHAKAIVQKSLELKNKNALYSRLNKKGIAYSWGGLGSIYFALEQYNEAAQAFGKAIELQPKLDIARRSLGDVYLALEQYDKALKNYKKAIDLNPKKARWWNVIGNIYYDIGSYEDAAISYNKAIELDASGAYLYWGNIGILHITNNNIDKAKEAFMKSIEIDSEYLYSVLSLALCYKITGNISESEKLIKSVEVTIKNNIEYTQACFYIAKEDIENGLLFLKQGLNKKQASKTWAQKDPNFAAIRDNLLFKEIVGLDQT